jgi:hypothetical protein
MSDARCPIERDKLLAKIGLNLPRATDWFPNRYRASVSVVTEDLGTVHRCSYGNDDFLMMLCILPHVSTGIN